jgi:osmotically-inducible protein OsmY
VKDGWVTLKGKADWQFETNFAQWYVATLKGVLGVTNNIEVKSRVVHPRSKAKLKVPCNGVPHSTRVESRLMSQMGAA